jgi:hypothetical protein
MHLLISILDFLLLGFFFYPLVVGLLLLAYAVTASLEKEKEWGVGPLLLLTLTGGALLYHFPILRSTDWSVWAGVTGGYMAVGFMVSLYKWVDVLIAFRKRPVAADIVEAKEEEYRCSPQNHAAARLKDAANRLTGYREPYCDCVADCNDDGTITLRPDWRKHPIAAWATYWPFFALSIPFDWLKRGIERITNWLRQFWDGIARRFSVRG